MEENLDFHARSRSAARLSVAAYRAVRIQAVRRIWEIVGDDRVDEDDDRYLETLDGRGRVILVLGFREALGSTSPS
jgi:hypothetical protein